MQVCTLLQTDNHANTSPLSFLQAGCPSCRPTNSVKALKAFMKQWSDRKAEKENGWREYSASTRKTSRKVIIIRSKEYRNSKHKTMVSHQHP